MVRSITLERFSISRICLSISSMLESVLAYGTTPTVTPQLAQRTNESRYLALAGTSSQTSQAVPPQ